MTRRKLRRKLMSHCPFCHAEQTMDKLHSRFYACGTIGDRRTAVYQKACKK